MNRYKKIAAASVALVIIFCLAFIAAGRWRAKYRAGDNVSMGTLKEALEIVETKYVEKPDRSKLVKSMIDGMLLSLDPHSAYLPPEPFKEMEAQMSGAFGGVGIELGMKDGKLTVISPIEDTPAFRAGIQSNDHIWKIDGTATRGMSINDAVKRMRGEKGARVSLGIIRGESTKPLVFNLIRDTIRLKSLTSNTIEPGYAYIRISQFQVRTGVEFRQTLDDIYKANPEGLKGLVLDLRFNPGGLLEPAVQVANYFIGEDINRTLIVSVKGRGPNSTRDYNATVGQKEPHYPMVVLINGGSASASEILAGALQDHKRAVIMGKQSFGKGSVQSIIPLPNNAAIKLTTALYYTPSGRSIQAKGIVPDIEAGSEAPAVLRNMSGTPSPVKEKSPPSMHFRPRAADPTTDAQLKRAFDLLKELDTMKKSAFLP